MLILLAIDRKAVQIFTMMKKLKILSLLLLWSSMLLSLSPTCDGQVILQCPAEKARVSEGQIVFSPLSEVTPVEVVYVQPALSNWNAMANGFSSGVGRQTLPYEEAIIPLINQSLIQPSTRIDLTSISSGESTASSIDIAGIFNMFSDWLIPTIVVAALGIVLGIILLITGFTFFCCRFCGKCGGGDIDPEKDMSLNSNTMGMCISVSILLLIAIAVFAACILLFVTGTQSSAMTVHQTFLEVVDDTGDYTSDTIQQLYEIFCQLLFGGGVLSAVVDEFDDFDEHLADTALEVVTEVVTNHPDLELTFSQTKQISRNVTTGALVLLTDFADLISSIGGISLDLVRLSGNCILTGSLTAIGLCTDVIDPLENVVDSAYSEFEMIELPNIEPFVENAVEVLQSAAEVISAEGGDVVNSLIEDVTHQVNSTITDALGAIDQYDETFGPLISQLREIHQLVTDVGVAGVEAGVVPSQCPAIEGLQAFNSIGLPNLDISLGQEPGTVQVDSDLFKLTRGYVRECLINAAFNSYLLPYDNIRVGVFVAIGVLALIPIILVGCGCLCGCFGFKGKRRPSDRSSSSNTGGKCLLMSVFTTYVLGAGFLCVCALIFLVSSNSLKLCRSLEEPQYELLAQTIDNPEVKQSIRAVTNITIIDIADVPSVSQLLRDCKANNTALFTAFNLGSLLHVPTGTIGGAVRSFLNITTIQSRVDSLLQFAVNTLDINAESIERILERVINQTQRIDLRKLNLTDFAAAVDHAVGEINIDKGIQDLRNLSLQLQTLGENDPVENINDIIAELQHVQDTLSSITSQFLKLTQQVDGFDDVQEELIRNLASIIVAFAEELDRLSEPIFEGFLNETLRGAIYRTFGYFDQYIDHVENQIMNTVGGCQPLYGMLTKVHNSVCRGYLDGVNGFWWSLGFCCVLYVLLILLATIGSQFFIRKKVEQVCLEKNLDYPMINVSSTPKKTF